MRCGKFFTLKWAWRDCVVGTPDDVSLMALRERLMLVAAIAGQHQSSRQQDSCRTEGEYADDQPKTIAKT